MDFETDIRPISYLKSNTSELLKFLWNKHRPVILTQNGEAKAVIQDMKSYHRMQKAIDLLKLIAHSEQDIKADRILEQKKVFADLEKHITHGEV